jgi:hypothetical protein
MLGVADAKPRSQCRDDRRHEQSFVILCSFRLGNAINFPTSWEMPLISEPVRKCDQFPHPKILYLARRPAAISHHLIRSFLDRGQGRSRAMAELCADQAESTPGEAEVAWGHPSRRKAAGHEARSAVTSAPSVTPIADMVEVMLAGAILSTGTPVEFVVLAIRTAERARGGADPVADRRRAFDREEQRVAARREQNLVNQRNSRTRRQRVSADNADTPSPSSSPPTPSPIAPPAPL